MTGKTFDLRKICYDLRPKYHKRVRASPMVAIEPGSQQLNAKGAVAHLDNHSIQHQSHQTNRPLELHLIGLHETAVHLGSNTGMILTEAVGA